MLTELGYGGRLRWVITDNKACVEPMALTRVDLSGRYSQNAWPPCFQVHTSSSNPGLASQEAYFVDVATQGGVCLFVLNQQPTYYMYTCTVKQMECLFWSPQVRFQFTLLVDTALLSSLYVYVTLTVIVGSVQSDLASYQIIPVGDLKKG